MFTTLQKEKTSELVSNYEMFREKIHREIRKRSKHKNNLHSF